MYLPIDKLTGEPKGFAFVNFDNSKIASELCSEGKFIINGKEVSSLYLALQWCNIALRTFLNCSLPLN